MTMKKLTAIIMILALCLTLVTGATAETTQGMKLGIAVDTTLTKSKDAGEKDGMAQVDTVAVAVLVDAEGKIADLDIDAVQAKMPFTAQGTLAAEFPATVSTKKELGDDYGMRAASAIGKEWNEQITALTDYLVGKTVEEVKAVEMDESTKPVDVELTAGCTMSIGGYLNSVVSAMENAVDCGASATDKVGMGVVTTTSKSKDAADGKDGQCQAYSTFVATAVDANGAITACRMDCTQGTVTFDATGKITKDLQARVATKHELGDDYGMRAASAIGKEWNEQADAFVAYALGKTAADIEGIAMDESNKATDAELTASVTISLGDIQGAVLNAVANAAK